VIDDKVFEIEKQIITDLSKSESCVIVGKCADWILTGKKEVIRVYIEAPRRYCLNRIMKRMNVDEAKATELIVNTDKYRADYYKYYTGGREWTNCTNYDLVLDSERIGQDDCVNIIMYYLQRKLNENWLRAVDIR
jgi:cytidylate kinase